MTKTCENCAAMRYVAGWLISLPLRLFALVAIVSGLAAFWLATWLDDAVTKSRINTNVDSGEHDEHRD